MTEREIPPTGRERALFDAATQGQPEAFVRLCEVIGRKPNQVLDLCRCADATLAAPPPARHPRRHSARAASPSQAASPRRAGAAARPRSSRCPRREVDRSLQLTTPGQSARRLMSHSPWQLFGELECRTNIGGVDRSGRARLPRRMRSEMRSDTTAGKESSGPSIVDSS